MPKFKELMNPPPEPEGSAEAQLAALRDYLVKIIQELQYLLSHLETDNINDAVFQQIYRKIPQPYGGLPLMDGAASSGGSGNWARGDHRHPSDAAKADATALEDHVGDTANPHGVTKGQVGLGNVDNVQQYSASNPPPIPTPGQVGAIPTTEKGSAGGVAELDANGRVPSAQLPSYVDDVLEYADAASFPATGESGKIYVALDTNRTYRWGGSAYVEISESLALGETSSTAYRGDRGKTAYDHSQTTGNPHGTTAADVGARADTWTPSKSDIGLGNVADERQYSAQNPPPAPDAEDVAYSSTDPRMSATDVKAAIDELLDDKADIADLPFPSGPADFPLMDGTAAVGSMDEYARADHIHPSDTAKANQAQLATVESGSTASRAYAVDEYFCWNGLLYRVTAAISSGGTFTPGTNCVTETVGERLGLIKTVLCATGTSANPVNTVIPLKNSHTYLVMIQRVGDQYSSFGLIVQSNGTVWKNDLASGGEYSNRYSVSTSTRTLTITAYLSAVTASIIDFGAYA